MSKSGLAAVLLSEAMQRPGCPICRTCADYETRYLMCLVKENVNHIATRVHLSHSLGLCRRHAWQALKLERESLGMILGNCIICDGLVSLVRARVRQARTEGGTWRDRRGWVRRAVAWLGAPTRSRPTRLSRLLTATEPCRACALSAQTAERHGAVLVELLTEKRFRDLYRASDGICLPHLAGILQSVAPGIGLDHLLTLTEEHLAGLAGHLAALDQAYRTCHLCDPLASPAKRSVEEAILFLTGGQPAMNAWATPSELEERGHESHDELL